MNLKNKCTQSLLWSIMNTNLLNEPQGFVHRDLLPAFRLSLSIILTLLSMCDTKNMITKGLLLVPHIDSRAKIIDNERLGASPCSSLFQGSYTVLLSKFKDFPGQKLQFSSTFF